MRRINKNLLYDRLHKVTVTGLMMLTGYGILLLGFRTYNYFNYVRPMRNEERRMLLEEQILQEQQEREAEYYRKKREREELNTNA